MDNQLPLDRMTLPARVVFLGGGLGLSECVAADGSTTYWILSGDENAEAGSASRFAAPHEQAGALPTDWKRKLGLECGAITRKGTSCRTLVSTFGERCTWHTDKPAEGRLF